MKRSGPIRRKTRLRTFTPIKSKRLKPRRGPERNPEYRAWLRTQPCIACLRDPAPGFRKGSSQIEAAHTANNGMSSKGTDSSCVPLCRSHHTESHRIGVKQFQAKFEMDLRAEARAHYAAFNQSRNSLAA